MTLQSSWPPFAACLWNKPPWDCFAQWEGTYDALIGGDDPNARVSLSCPDGSSGSDSWPWVAPLVMSDEAWPQITPDGRLDGEYFNPIFFDGTRWQWHFDPAPPE